ncbi:MAG TPA: glycoside hydrolase family 97 catalytic domain-containing protein [Solirubrobacteraceae bacterium]|nr:glycoside hydrolase family 97 catalytic domain-containing protein [Solirubrobacteraceae bacterium]
MSVTARHGAVELEVARDGRRVLAASLDGAANGVRAAKQDVLHDRFATPAGKRRVHQLDARRLTLELAAGRQVEVLVADDGVAFRQTGDGAHRAAWRAPVGARAWLQSYRPDYEGPYRPVALWSAARGDYGMPALLDAGRGTWALLTESGLTREAAARLTVSGDRHGVLNVALGAGEPSPRRTPWRVAVIGDLPTVVGSDLPISLGRPTAIRDVSWIRPGRAAWSWWSDSKSPGDASRQRAMIRAAAAHRWEYVLLDEGWNPDDVPAIARYAADRGVRVVLWTAWDALRDARTRERLFARWAGWGVAGVKVDFLLSDSASRMAVYDDIARDAARHKLAVVFHGCTVPRGIQRRWPNVLTMEAVEGTEREIPGQGSETMDPRQDVNYVFTRNVIGSMDYTPVTFSARNRDSTDAHRLALAVVYESGLQHFADSPESYERHPLATAVLRDVPAAWDETRLLAGAPDREAVLARRSGQDWWVGSISALDAHVQTASLGFLAADRTYRLHLVRDDGRGGLAVEDRTVTSRDSLSVAVERNGGFTAELTPEP